MKKIICFLGIILLFLSGRTALAEWKRVDTYSEGTIYLDTNRIREKMERFIFGF